MLWSNAAPTHENNATTVMAGKPPTAPLKTGAAAAAPADEPPPRPAYCAWVYTTAANEIGSWSLDQKAREDKNIYQRDINGNTPRTQCRQARQVMADMKFKYTRDSCWGMTGGGVPDAYSSKASAAQVMIGEVGETH